MDIIPLPRCSALSPEPGFSCENLRVAAPGMAAEAIALLISWAGQNPDLSLEANAGDTANIHLIERQPTLSGAEAYDLKITSEGIWIHSLTSTGFSYAIQSLLALGTDGKPGSWPALNIEDAPHFAWRGLLLDSCRHFISKAGILRLLDQMAQLKLNRLHWHLTDDQGWRLQIKRYPKLTEVGAWRDRDGVREGGFYTQAEVREIVAYAAKRGIEIMPEIELPGHATAAIAAYPELGCQDKPLEVGTAWGIYPNNYNAGDERVFQFLEEVLTEVMELFPFPYLHLGADECVKDEWKTSESCQRRIREEKLGDEYGLQTYFVNRIAAFLSRQGRTAVGWDEVLEGEISGDMIVQCWRDESIIKLALERGFNVIAAPRRYCYFDIAVGQVDLADVYAFDPSAGVPASDNGASVIGGEATLWTEYIREEDMDHMLFPRLLAMSEALWLGPQNKQPLPDFIQRTRKVMERLQAAGVKPGPMLRSDGPLESMKGRKDLDVPPAGLDKIGVG